MARELVRVLFINLAVALIVTCADHGHAAEAGAEALFRAGREALKQGDTGQACKWFQESERLEPAPGTELNLAMCEKERGHLVRAWQLLQQVLHALPETDERSAIARAEVSALEERIARVVIEPAPGLPPGTRVVSGDTEYHAASFGIAIPMDPGTYSFEVRALGRRVRRYERVLEAGSRTTLRIEAGAPTQPPRPPPRTDDATTARRWGIVAAGGSVAALTASAVLGLGALRDKATMNEECNADGCSDAGLSAAQRGETLARASTATFVGALVMGAVSAVILLTTGGHPVAQRNASAVSGLQLEM